jgi:hypothetical protein
LNEPAADKVLFFLRKSSGLQIRLTRPAHKFKTQSRTSALIMLLMTLGAANPALD